uniref:Mytilus inhibitory peptide 2 n=1 Tax=Deroceras reticulatum TaxID=145610 RepID=A0A1X9WEE1_DERRE|nr:mytilus inhibitory peptide 2 [Deroceras reticulatum]
MQRPTLLVFVTSLIVLLVRAETQSAHIASSNADASHALTLSQPQQQPQQQALSPHFTHLASDQPAVGGDGSASAYHSTSNHNVGLDRSLSSLNSGVSSQPNSNIHTDETKNMKTDYGQIKTSSFANDLRNILHLYSSDDSSYSPQEDVLIKDTQRNDHRVDKREAVIYPVVDGHTESDFLDDEYPIYLDRRFQVFLPSSASLSPPYLSAQEFKETFRRSDPYFMGKRATDLVSGEDLLSPVETRAAPKFVGRRQAPFFVGKRESPIDIDSYLASLSSQDDDDSTFLEDRRGAPKFVGRRGAPFMVGKRAAPKFVGKRLPVFDVEDIAFLSAEEKRAAPKFVGRRAAPKFVGKRGATYFEEKREHSDALNELSPEDELNWLLENKNAASKYVGRRGAPYFVGKRGPPMFVGKRDGLFELEDDESPFLNDREEMDNFINRRGAPYFVGKRRAPKFVGKRWANPELQKQTLEVLEDKRGAPKFVGRRASPYFVGKREESTSSEEEDLGLADEDTQLFSDKRRAPKFVGRRGAPRFIGKRKSPMFIGKGKSPMFIGKREGDYDWVGSSLLRSEETRGAPKFVGRRGAPRFVGRRGAPRFVGKRGAPKFVGRRGAPRFVGRRGAPRFVGKRDFYLLNDNTVKALPGDEATDLEQETVGLLDPLLQEGSLNSDKSILSQVKMENKSTEQTLQNHTHLQAKENEHLGGETATENVSEDRTSDEISETALTEESEQIR